MSAYHLEDDGDLLRVYRIMDGHRVCVAVEAHTWRQGSEWTGAWLDADGTANELRHLANCATACEGMGDPAAEIARLRGIESHVSNGGTWVPIAQLREALDALERMGRAYAALLVFASQGRLTAADLRAAEIEPLPLTWHTEDGAPCVDEPVLCKHGRAV